MVHEITARFSEAFDKFLVERQQQREAVARFIATFDLSSLYAESTAVNRPADQEVDLSF